MAGSLGLGFNLVWDLRFRLEHYGSREVRVYGPSPAAPPDAKPLNVQPC